MDKRVQKKDPKLIGSFFKILSEKDYE